MRRSIHTLTIISFCAFGASFDCNGKAFLCLDSTAFYQCVQHQTETVSKGIYPCPQGLICDNSQEIECVDPALFTHQHPTVLIFGDSSENLIPDDLPAGNGGGSLATEEMENVDVSEDTTSGIYESSCITDVNVVTSTVSEEIVAVQTVNAMSSSSFPKLSLVAANTDKILTTAADGDGWMKATERDLRNSNKFWTEISYDYLTNFGTDKVETSADSETVDSEITEFESETSANEIGSLLEIMSNVVGEKEGKIEISSEIDGSGKSTETLSETSSTNKVAPSSNYVTDSVTEAESRTKDTTPAFPPTMPGNMPSTMETAVSTESREFICKLPGKFPDTTDCHTYHLCLNVRDLYIDVTMRCPHTRQYNPDTKRCTYFPVRCPGDPPLICPRPGKYPHPTHCDRYYKCTKIPHLENYGITQFRCKDNKLFDAERSRCVHERFAKCLHKEAQDDFICPSAGRFPFEGNYGKFYLCTYLNGHLHYKIKDCWRGQAFDTEERRCKKTDKIQADYVFR